MLHFCHLSVTLVYIGNQPKHSFVLSPKAIVLAHGILLSTTASSTLPPNGWFFIVFEEGRRGRWGRQGRI
jgi:hypothetical protein